MQLMQKHTNLHGYNFDAFMTKRSMRVLVRGPWDLWSLPQPSCTQITLSSVGVTSRQDDSPEMDLVGQFSC